MFITFEGGEGSGKSTQIARAAAYLVERGFAVVSTREPGGTAIGDRIRAVLLDAANAHLDPTAELFLYFAARAQHVAEVIRPALAAGKIVLCDRFADSTWVYQGHARGLGVELVEKLNAIATGGLAPDLTLVFDLSVELGLERARARAAALTGAAREDRFEQEDFDFHCRLREGFGLLVERNPARCRTIDATADVEMVWRRTRAMLDAELPSAPGDE